METDHTQFCFLFCPFVPAHSKIFLNTLVFWQQPFYLKKVMCMHLSFDLSLLFRLYHLQEKLQLLKISVSVLCACHWAKHLQILFHSPRNSIKYIYFLIRKLRPTKTQDHTTRDLLDMVLTYPAFLGKDLRNCRNVPYFIMYILKVSPSSDFNIFYLFCITVKMWILE